MTTQTKPQTTPNLRKFNTREYQAMSQIGILRPYERVELLDGEIVLMGTGGERRKFTVAEYYAMAMRGIIRPGERVELLYGEIIKMSPIGDDHAASVNALMDLLIKRIGERATVTVQNPLRLDANHEPEPDLILARYREDYYRSGHPGPDDVLLLIEVSDSTIESDRNEKLPLYARYRIPEVWIINLRDHRIEIYTDPIDGRYATTRTAHPNQTISPTALPDITLPTTPITGHTDS